LPDPGNPDCAELDITISETARLEGMVKDMLDFFRPLALNRVEVDICSMVEECPAIVEENAKSQKVSIQSTLSDDLPPMLIDPMRIRQALINLLTNAVQASSAGDRVTVQCCCQGRHLFFDVSDNGCVIPSEIREAMFFPFVTTRKNGPGLGLSNVEKIPDAHGGFGEVFDNSWRGLTFRPTIPT